MIRLHSTAGRRARPRLAQVLAGLALAAGAVAPAFASDNGADGDTVPQAAPGVDDARRVLEQWVDTRRLISKEQLDHALALELLNERIELVQREIESARAAIARTQEDIAEVDGRRDELTSRNEELRRGTSTLAAVIDALEARTRSLLLLLPEPVRETIAPLSQRLPQNPADTHLSLSQRFQNVLGVLNQLNKSQREVAVTSELRTLPDGSAAQVTALYLGLGMAWYVGGNGRAAGVGGPTPQGWAWTPDDTAAADIAEAIAIHRGESLARFLPLPLEIR